MLIFSYVDILVCFVGVVLTFICILQRIFCNLLMTNLLSSIVYLGVSVCIYSVLLYK